MSEIPTEHLQLQKMRASLEKLEKALESIGQDTLRVAVIPKTFKTAKIDTDGTLGDKVIVAGVSAKRIKVYAGRFVVTAAVNCKWKSGANDISGDENYGSKGEGWADSVQPPAFLMATNVGESLVLNLSSAVAVDGIIAYWDDDAS